MPAVKKSDTVCEFIKMYTGNIPVDLICAKAFEDRMPSFCSEGPPETGSSDIIQAELPETTDCFDRRFLSFLAYRPLLQLNNDIWPIAPDSPLMMLTICHVTKISSRTWRSQ